MKLFCRDNFKTKLPFKYMLLLLILIFALIGGSVFIFVPTMQRGYIDNLAQLRQKTNLYQLLDFEVEGELFFVEYVHFNIWRITVFGKLTEKAWHEFLYSDNKNIKKCKLDSIELANFTVKNIPEEVWNKFKIKKMESEKYHYQFIDSTGKIITNICNIKYFTFYILDLFVEPVSRRFVMDLHMRSGKSYYTPKNLEEYGMQAIK